ncbi:MAG: hypothetical protein P0Y53_09270 [Candidatus Pseudobacter hemicellulosilyticus]|uniref:Alpha-L-rhamnosidase six-hairpin glycosidase domain-containing protein n=1 Tax=Candidatus Pseudobacter hemicellulosilyticus TaxID=3121375 RepID=A0AAJ5WT03_9BACT|nr:MAG: hypothetical protein P0Y53_09270 [Pseudobacter sp.]
MKKAFLFLFAICLLVKAMAADPPVNYLVEAESFQFTGGWQAERSSLCMGSTMLRVMGGPVAAADALTVINIKKAGEYTVWVRAADYKDRQGTRLFRLLVDEQPMAEAGKHGNEGFAWEKVGRATLSARQVLLRLKDTKKNFGRCDAVLLTTDAALDPNTLKPVELARWRIAPVKMPVSGGEKAAISAPLVLTENAETVAGIGNEQLRLRFVKGGVNNKGLGAKAEYRLNGKWTSMNALLEDHKIYLLSADTPAINFGSFFPSWNGSKATRFFTLNGQRYTMQQPEDLLNPFAAGELSEAIPYAVEKTDNNTLAVSYITEDGTQLTGEWAVQGRHLTVQLTFEAARTAFYSLGIAAFQGVDTSAVSNILLPPMFQYRRFSPEPVLLVSSMMQQAVAIAESSVAAGKVSSFVSGDTSTFPLEWGYSQTSPMGFAIKNDKNQVQPVAFSPVLGLANSKFKTGATISRKFVLGILPTGWNEALEYISDSVYQVRDYRKQQGSLTDALFNMIDLVRNGSAAGWDPLLKGFYDIEANPATAATVVHPAPLSMVATAVVLQDEDFYLKRALPTIEYTLSRSGYRWAKAVVPSSYNNNKKTLQLDPIHSQFTTAYYEGLNSLLGNANPWLKAIALPENQVRKADGYSVLIPGWVQQLAAYRLTKETHWLEAAKAAADQYILEKAYNNSPAPFGKVPFYNTSFYAYWWDLLDLYELTKEERYLKAAEYSAFHTIAGIRTYPFVRDTLQTIHAGGKFTGNTTMWWKGDKKYRLGFPRIAGDAPEKQVPQALVSPVGLGFEQPYTYFDAGKEVRPVYMSSWAPHLLRLYQYTRRPLFQTYARNAVIGRFTNYPGYYAPGFTDITMQPDFPYKGPDVSSVYYHHIPAHMAFTWDFLVTEAIQRFAGQLQFPYGKQDGFVWFTNRLYGAGAGTVFEDTKARLWMKRGLVQLNSPEVNYITARSADRFWVILCSESDKPLPLELSIGKAAGIIAQGNASLHTAGKTTAASLPLKQNKVSLTLDNKGAVAISFPLQQQTNFTTPLPLREGMVVIDMGEPWGQLRFFRIRSPFGWDSIFGFAETGPLDGAQATATCNGQTLTLNSYPYEWSFVRIAPMQKASVTVTLTTADGKKQVKTIQLPGQ